MRFFYPALAVSFAALVSGIAIDTSKWTIADLEDVTEVLIEEQCRGALKWSEDGFFRSGTTVRYHGHLWQCTHWNRGENPENSDIWRDLGECDPDFSESTQQNLSKRSTSNLQALDDDDEEPNCEGVIEWDSKALYRSGSTVHHGDHLYQTSVWTEGEEPTKAGKWRDVATCPGGSFKKVKRDECAGLRIYQENGFYRSGTTVRFNDNMYQARKWVKGKAPTDEKFWKFLESC